MTERHPEPSPRAGRAFHRAAVAAAALLTAAAAASAVQPQRWVHTTEADFQDGEANDVAITNLGDLKLSRAVEDLGALPDGVSIVFDAQRIGETLYVAGGPEGVVLRVSDEGYERVAEYAGEQVFCLDRRGEALLVGVSGENSRIEAIAEGAGRTLVELKDVRYVWDMSVAEDRVFVATGTEGRVLVADLDLDGGEAAEAAVRTVLDTEQANVLCLARDDQGRLYAGTDTQGLVFRVAFDQAGAAQPYVLLDAAEPEIGDLVVMPDGTVYAATADANQARPGRLEQPAEEQAGRPAEQQSDAEQPAPDAPDAPGPGDIPDAPPQPDPVEGEPAPEKQPDAASTAADAESAEGEAPDAVQLEPEPAEPAQPTAEQYDELREQVRARLEAAEEGEPLQVSGQAMQGQNNRGGGAAAGSRVRPPSSAGANKPGNAIYRIDPEGFVSEVFRESVMFLKLTATDAGLLAATGNQGQVYRVDPATEEALILTDLEAEQVPVVMPLDNGASLLGTANPARLLRLTAERADTGAYTSRVLDAAQVSLWGVMRLTADVPEGSRIGVQTRSSNVGDPANPAWSDWTEPVLLEHDADHPALQPREVEVASPPARFLQYRLTLEAGEATEPVVDRVASAYVVPNLPPRIAAVTSRRDEPDLTGEEPAPTTVKLSWEATDPNEDRLTFDLHFRPQGTERFLELAEDVEQTRYEWETRRVPDGWYLLRVTADDGLDNPPDMTRTVSRLSDPILVDHTPPDVEARAAVAPGGAVTLSGKVRDARAPIAGIAYATNGAERYVPILSEDLILDSTSESFEVTVQGFDPGPHVVTIRAVDAQGNATYRALTFDVPG